MRDRPSSFFAAAASIAAIAAPAAGGTLLPPFSEAAFVRGAPIDNPYFPIIPGRQVTIAANGIDEDGEEFSERSVLTDKGSGPVIAGVKTRTQLDQAYEDGLLVEETFDYYAQDRAGNVWYFGEDVTNFYYDDDDTLIGTDNASAWIAGVDGALPGWIMPGLPEVGLAYYQEFAAENEALDQARIYALGETVLTPLGRFDDVLVSYETNPLEPDAQEFKYYAPGIGLIRAEEGLSEDLTDPELVFEIASVAQVPLPPALPALGLACLGLAAFRRRRARRD